MIKCMQLQEKGHQTSFAMIEPEIYKDRESNLAGPEEVQHYPMDCLTDHQGIQPVTKEIRTKK